MIGMASVVDGYPLYYDATNEAGLSMAGLNFPGFATYYPMQDGKDNITPFELIPWILGQCANVCDALKLLETINLMAEPFSREIPLSPLHWIIADSDQSVTVETLKDGMKIHDNPIGILTNNPPFDYHMLHLTDYLNITPHDAENRFAPGISLEPYSRGMGTMGLPGDLSSASRFVRAAYTKLNSVSGESEAESISQFFHILSSTSQQRGTVIYNGAYEITYYSSCCNTNLGIYYYTTYENSQITGIDMHRVDLDQNELIAYPLRRTQNIYWEN
jgi:choloylglycine hydrolase